MGAQLEEYIVKTGGDLDVILSTLLLKECGRERLIKTSIQTGRVSINRRIVERVSNIYTFTE